MTTTTTFKRLLLLLGLIGGVDDDCYAYYGIAEQSRDYLKNYNMSGGKKNSWLFYLAVAQLFAFVMNQNPSPSCCICGI